MDARRKKLLFRSEHCGWKENDFLLGRFARAHLDNLSETDLSAFEALLSESDNDIYIWITGKEPPPKIHDNKLMTVLIEFTQTK
ncbi:MAG: hypothetical protein CBB68_11820 [Rhodospirillaceae bacterium TMED8]|nr:succinate dehydrogenase assembly factor 2 [Magnetovibrio sp.]OUT49518.1 MAG: hypothetical protein CBB68_11820 [Rhodospirillaceae bacterium TMED8]|tara:strand:+ start:421 stop:672 length:252 start_codon:yes stop_codon:yes gene_type:complete